MCRGPGDEQSRCPENRTNGRRSAKRAVIRTARSARTLSIYMSVTTATHRPAVTHPDTHRDKKKTARRAAFPQPRGRFRW